MANFPGRRAGNNISEEASINGAIWSPKHANRRLSIGSKSSSLQFPTFENAAPSISFEDEASFDEPNFSDSFHYEEDNFDECLPFPEPQKKQRNPSRRSSGACDSKRKDRGRKENLSPTMKSPVRQKKRNTSDNIAASVDRTLLSPKLSPKRGSPGKKRVALKVRASDLSESKRKEIESLFRQLRTEAPDSVQRTEKESQEKHHRKRSSSAGRRRSSELEQPKQSSTGSSQRSKSRRGRSVDRSSKDSGKRSERSRSRQNKNRDERLTDERKHEEERKQGRSRSSRRRSTKERERSRSRGSERKRSSSRVALPKEKPQPESFEDDSDDNFASLKESLDLLKSTLEAGRV